jgi:protein FAM32A
MNKSFSDDSEKKTANKEIKVNSNINFIKGRLKFKNESSQLSLSRTDNKDKIIIQNNKIEEDVLYKNLTHSEKQFLNRKLNRLPDKIKKTLQTTYKQKYENFNKSLSKLPEHYDIPKVGPG